MATEKNKTNLPIRKKTRERIRKLKEMKEDGRAESYDDVINRLLDKIEVE